MTLSMSVSLPSHALDPSVYTNDYSDPLHPLCQRHIQVNGNGKTFHYSGTAVGPVDDPVRRGCSAAEIKAYKIRQGAFDGVVLENGAVSAGDGIHEGIWEPAGSAATTLGYEDVDGIRWNDGNKWVVQKPNLLKQGFLYFFLTYIVVSLLAGLNEMIKRVQSSGSD